MTARINLPSQSAETANLARRANFSSRFRKLLFIIHMVLGISTSLYFCAMSVSGASLVFKDELEISLTKRPKIQAIGSLAPLATVVANVEKRYPDQQVSGLIYSLEADRPLLLYVLNKNGIYSPVLVNPYDATVIGDAPENGFLKWLTDLHHNLLFGKTGRKINGIGGAILFVLALSGITLFLRGMQYCIHTIKLKWTKSTRVNAWSLHQKLGFFLVPSLLTWGLSGFNFGFRPEFERALNVILPVTALRSGKHSDSKKKRRRETVPTETATTTLTAAPIKSTQLESAPTKSEPDESRSNSSLTSAESLNLLIPLATKTCPGQQVVRIATAIEGNDTAKIWLTNSNSYNKSDNTEVDINAATGAVTSVSSPAKRSAGDLLLAWLPRMHFGNFGGIPIKALWVVLGLSPFVLSITGVLMWWHRKPKSQSPAIK